MKQFVLLTALIPALLFGQNQNLPQNVWAPFYYFSGSWSGHETGKSGIGKGRRTYEFIMDSTYLHWKNRSVFEPQEKNQKGEVHEDWGFISYDKGRDVFVMRQFNIEGYVNQFKLDTLSVDHKAFVFVSEQSENAPPELRARISYHIKNEDEFVETFELAFPNREFSEWLKIVWTRKEPEKSK